MASFPGIYRAKAVSVNGTKLSAFIPQVFGDVPVTIESFVGGLPTSNTMGWVSFQGGSPESPVWHGVGSAATTGSGDTVWVGPDPPTDPSIELWWDTDEEEEFDERYIAADDGIAFGTFTVDGALIANEGGTFAESVTLNTAPATDQHATNKLYVDTEVATRLPADTTLLAKGGSVVLTTDSSGNVNITHGLGRTPIGWVAMIHGTTVYLCSSPAGAANSTTFPISVFRRDTGAAATSVAGLTFRWMAY